MNNPKSIRAANPIHIGMYPSLLIAALSISTPYVSGKANDNGLMTAGICDNGIKRPHKNIMGNLKKLENVIASKTSLTETAINNPRKVDVTAIKITLIITGTQLIPDRLIKNNEKTIGTNAFKIPNIIAPAVFAIISKFKSIGASSSLSKDPPFLSKVMVTASMDVVPKRIHIAIIPGRIPLMSTSVFERNKNISVQANGNMIPQLILGGLR